MPTSSPRSPRRVVRKAFLAAAAAAGRSYQWPMSRYEQSPTNSQQRKNWTRLALRASPSMAAVNRAMTAK